jgi:hypothetical protein
MQSVLEEVEGWKIKLIDISRRDASGGPPRVMNIHLIGLIREYHRVYILT